MDSGRLNRAFQKSAKNDSLWETFGDAIGAAPAVSKGGAPKGNQYRLSHGFYSELQKTRRAACRAEMRDLRGINDGLDALAPMLDLLDEARLQVRQAKLAAIVQGFRPLDLPGTGRLRLRCAGESSRTQTLETEGAGRLSHPPLSESARDMAGHSQFKNIMHRKGRVDAVRSKVFSKLAREITVAAKLGMPDPAHNPRLRAAIIAAKAQSMPKDNIQRAIDKAAGAGAENIEEVRYEGYGPGGVALIVETLTDNRNRTGGDVRSTFSKYGGALGEPNSVTFLFDRKGVIVYPRDKGSDDAMLEAAIETGCDECVSTEDGHEFLVGLEDFGAARDALEEKFGAPQSARIEWRPKSTTAVGDDTGETLVKLLDALDDFDDVQNIYGNYELSPALMEKLGG